MAHAEIQYLIENYNSASLNELIMDWSQRETESEQSGIDIRHQIVEQVIPQLSSINLDLVRDLYIEQSKCAYEKCGVHIHFNLLGKELLTRGGIKYIKDYFMATSYCQGTCLISIPTGLEKENALGILNHLKDEIADDINLLNQRLMDEILV